MTRFRGPSSPVRPTSGGTGTVVSVLLFLGILAALGAFGDLSRLLALW